MKGNDVAAVEDFNPRSPRGERPGMARMPACLTYFNPRSPRGERLLLGILCHLDILISIHAPLAGSDGGQNSQ